MTDTEARANAIPDIGNFKKILKQLGEKTDELKLYGIGYFR